MRKGPRRRGRVEVRGTILVGRNRLGLGPLPGSKGRNEATKFVAEMRVGDLGEIEIEVNIGQWSAHKLEFNELDAYPVFTRAVYCRWSLIEVFNDRCNCTSSIYCVPTCFSA